MAEGFLCPFRFFRVTFPLDQIQYLLLLGIVLEPNDLVYVKTAFVDSLTIHIIPNLMLYTLRIDDVLGWLTYATSSVSDSYRWWMESLH